MNKVRIALALSLGLIGLLLFSLQPSPLPVPSPLAGAWPKASPPSGMALLHIPTGLVHRSAGFAFRGGSLFDKRDFTISAALVKHPRGDLLIDAGFGADIDRQFQNMPVWFRWITSYELGRPVAQQLSAAGYERSKLRAIILTHAHWDHASGVGDLAETPVWVTPPEQRFILEGDWRSATARGFARARYDTYDFDDAAYLGFPRSFDVYGDGSVVIVPAPGHTPGSVVVFVCLPNARRYAFVGDLVWQLEGITQREERPWWTRISADSDAGGVRDNLLRMVALARAFPDLEIIPAHDARAFARLAKL